MAEAWIKMRTDLYRDPKVCVIADALMQADGELARHVAQNCQRDMTVTRNVTRNATVGALVTVWGVMRLRGKRHDDDLVCRGVTLSVLDDLTEIPGFGAAMASAGWAVQTENGVEFPNFFDEYNASPGNSRSSAAVRQQRYRERQKAKGDVSSDSSRDVTRDVTVTPREEKRREENTKEPKSKNTPREIALLFEGVAEQVVNDFKRLRQNKRAPITPTAVDGIRREAVKAGYSLEQALITCCERGWTGFKADWVQRGTQATILPAGRPSVAASFRNETYIGTPDDQLPDYLRDAVADA